MVLPGCNPGGGGGGDDDDDGPIDRPIANAGPDQFVDVGAIVQLDGSASVSLSGGDLDYHWALDSVPTGSAADLSDPNVVNPTFEADLPGSYVIGLLVQDAGYSSNPDFVVITAGDCLEAGDAVSGDRSYSYSPATLEAGRYYWKVRATDAFGSSRESDVVYFDYQNP